MRSELLLADSSTANFRQVLVSTAQADDAGCGVMSPDDCPAASRARTMVFPLSTALDTCPNLRGRGCSALCVPMSISGNSMGVFHVTTDDGSPPSGAVQANVEVVARRASERLAMLRAFEFSQTQANSDSLTGLMTRRSLETAVRQAPRHGHAVFRRLRRPRPLQGIERRVRTRRRRSRSADLRAGPPGLPAASRHPGPLRGRGVRHRPPGVSRRRSAPGARTSPATYGRSDRHRRDSRRSPSASASRHPTRRETSIMWSHWRMPLFSAPKPEVGIGSPFHRDRDLPAAAAANAELDPTGPPFGDSSDAALREPQHN